MQGDDGRARVNKADMQQVDGNRQWRSSIEKKRRLILRTLNNTKTHTDSQKQKKKHFCKAWKSKFER
jgi:hypothetical protein